MRGCRCVVLPAAELTGQATLNNGKATVLPACPAAPAVTGTGVLLFVCALHVVWSSHREKLSHKPEKTATASGLGIDTFKKRSPFRSSRHGHSLDGVSSAVPSVGEHRGGSFFNMSSILFWRRSGQHPRLFSYRVRRLVSPSNDIASFSQANGLSSVVPATELSFHRLVCVRGRAVSFSWAAV